jgi:hypothetical protein
LPRDIPFSVSAGVVAACALANGKASADWAVQHSRPPEFGPLHGLLYVWSSRGDPAAAAAWCAEKTPAISPSSPWETAGI